MLPKLTNIRGYPVELGDRIGGGGEGDVYRIINNPSSVAKIWHPNKRGDEQSAKISRMCSLNVDLHIKGDPVLAWPEDPILDNGSVVGYKMPMVRDHFTLYDCLTPERSRSNNLPIYATDRPLLASRIANIFAALHTNKCFVGDINPQNILIRRSSLVPILIDCDSFQIDDPEFPEFPFLSTVVTSEYRAPERTQSNTPIDHSVDVFGLAVIVYQLLLLGEHPYSGIDDPAGIVHIPPLAGRIADGRFAHAGHGRWQPRTNKVKQAWEALPQTVRNVLAQALDYRQFGRNRPTAQQISEVIRAHQTPLATILGRFSGHRSSSPDTSPRSPYRPQTVVSRRTQRPKVPAPSNPYATRRSQAANPKVGDESKNGLCSWLSEHWCCVLVIAIWIGFMVLQGIFE